MRSNRLKIVILGLSITSSWGNGHATTYRALTRALSRRGHQVLFLERDVPWYAEQRDLADPPYCPTRLYKGLAELESEHGRAVADADLVIVGSYVPDGAAVGEWVCDIATGIAAFYDIDTPVTLQGLSQGKCEYLTPELVGRYDLYLSFTGGPTLRRLERELGARMARSLYCAVDPDFYFPDEDPAPPSIDLGYLGTYSPDRQPKLEQLLVEPARRWPAGRFLVAGPLYPDDELCWPVNVERIEHVAPNDHRGFYTAQRFTLNLTRADMVAAGCSPSVRLFEAAACGTPICSDYWPGLEDFFQLGTEIIVADGPLDVLRALRRIQEPERLQIAAGARQRVLSQHTAAHRVRELEGHHAACLRDGQRRSA